MNTKKLIIISLAIGVLGVISYFAYPIVRDRYFPEVKTVTIIGSKPDTSNSTVTESQTTGTENGIPTAENSTLPENENVTPPASEEIIGNSISDSLTKNTGTKSNIKANITEIHCADACKAFASDLVLFAYCEQVCGISPIKTDSDCAGKKDLEKDYCQKDLAITKATASLCESIKDDNIRKTCQNRIAEDLVEKM